MQGAELWAATVETTGGTFVPGTPEWLFDGPFDTTQDADFDVFPDGHFLMGEADPDARPTRLQVVLGSRS